MLNIIHIVRMKETEAKEYGRKHFAERHSQDV